MLFGHQTGRRVCEMLSLSAVLQETLPAFHASEQCPASSACAPQRKNLGAHPTRLETEIGVGVDVFSHFSFLYT